MTISSFKLCARNSNRKVKKKKKKKKTTTIKLPIFRTRKKIVDKSFKRKTDQRDDIVTKWLERPPAFLYVCNNRRHISTNAAATSWNYVKFPGTSTSLNSSQLITPLSATIASRRKILNPTPFTVVLAKHSPPENGRGRGVGCVMI